MNHSNRLNICAACYSTVLLGLISIPAQGAALVLENTPLFTSNNAKPNLILAIDDSGSMDFEVLFTGSDGALWWNTSSETFAGVESAGVLNLNTAWNASDTWKKYVYLFPNGTDSGNRVYLDDTHAHFAIPPLPQYAFARASVYNQAYYDRNTTYDTWADYGVISYPPVTASSAPSDPASGSDSFDLTSDIESSDSNEVFKMYSGMVIPAGTYYKDWTDASWKTASADVAVISAGDSVSSRNVPIRYYPATYYVVAETGSFTLGASGFDCATPAAANYTTFHANPSALSSSDNIDALGPDGQCLRKIEIKSTTPNYFHNGNRSDCADSSQCTYAEEIQNFANWFSYYRKRHLALRAGMGNAFSGLAGLRAGLFTFNSQANVTMLDFDSQSDSFFNSLYTIDGNNGGSYSRSALDYAGTQFGRNDANAPIIEACQKNFTLLFSDGYSTITTPPNVGNQDGSEGSPYADSYDDTLGDIAMNYYNTVLRSGAGFPAGEVATPVGCNNANPDPILDCNANLHMNTYTVGLGAQGTLYGISHQTVADAHSTPPTWPNVNLSRDATQIDDLYHAAVNGRGEMFDAASPQELKNTLKQAITSIQAQIGVASSVTFNTSTLETNSAVFLAFFNSANWSGDIVAFDLNPVSGAVASNLAWSAADQLDSGSPGYDSRIILTHNGSDGVAFRWANLTASQQTDLNAAPGGNGQDALNYIRGDQSNEGVGQFRIRGSILGDIVHSDPVFVGVPQQFWPSSAPFPTASGERYFEFKNTLRSNPRTPMVYSGANDGMLHGFKASTGNADSGRELLAYIPSNVYSSAPLEGLHYLSDPTYQHRYYVDLAPTVSDVYIRTATSGSGATARWRTVLIGGNRSGGNGLFALDVTDPSQFSEANAADLVLWEFSHADLGFSYSKPTITMMENGQWAMIFGNGYNDTGSGVAKLFIVFLEGGLDGVWTDGSGGTDTDYVVLSTGVGSLATPNGLATPAVVDVNGNGAADRVYAGDLQGNLWAFDLSDSSSSQWTVAYTTSGAPAPLFIATDASSNRQPITSKPVLVYHPEPPGGTHDPNLLIFFGTGKYLELSDISDTSAQSFYGVWDDGTKEVDRSDLVQQTFLFNGTFTDSDGKALRIVSDNSVNYSNQQGWYIDLPSSGERVVVNPQVRGSLVFFNTWIPDSSACSAGGSGFLMSVKQLNGGRPDTAAFDISGDDTVDDTDQVTQSGVQYVPAGQEFVYGLPAASSFLSNMQYTPGTGGNTIDARVIENLGGLNTGRLSWEELR